MSARITPASHKSANPTEDGWTVVTRKKKKEKPPEKPAPVHRYSRRERFERQQKRAAEENLKRNTQKNLRDLPQPAKGKKEEWVEALPPAKAVPDVTSEKEFPSLKPTSSAGGFFAEYASIPHASHDHRMAQARMARFSGRDDDFDGSARSFSPDQVFDRDFSEKLRQQLRDALRGNSFGDEQRLPTARLHAPDYTGEYF